LFNDTVCIVVRGLIGVVLGLEGGGRFPCPWYSLTNNCVSYFLRSIIFHLSVIVINVHIILSMIIKYKLSKSVLSVFYFVSLFSYLLQQFWPVKITNIYIYTCTLKCTAENCGAKALNLNRYKCLTAWSILYQKVLSLLLIQK
jgi:hypothetical protein